MKTSKSPHQNDISRSEDRYSFQKESYINTQRSKNEPISQDYLDMLDQSISDHVNRFEDTETRQNNLEYDLLTTDWILDKVRDDDVYAQHVYAALCNTEWQKADPWMILKDEHWSCTWRYAGGIVADMRKEGDYIDWYCSGNLRGLSTAEYEQLCDNASADELLKYKEYMAYVREGIVTDEILDDFERLGWRLINVDD